MNIQQLQIAIAVAEAGSISKAANKLFLSQPNASETMKALEQELGFLIFWRTHTGISLTPKGAKFLEHARIIVHHADQISAINTANPTHRLLLGVSSYTPLLNAFLQLCKKYQHENKSEFTCKNIYITEGIHELYQLDLDLLAMIIPAQALDSIYQATGKHNLSMQKICDLPLNVNLRRGHPLASAESLDIMELQNYPYVDYLESGLAEVANKYTEKEYKIKYKSCIRVDERNLRCEIVGSSDAFSVGCKLPQEILKKFGLVSFPLPAEPLNLFVIFRQGEQADPDIQQYIRFLKEEMADF